MRGFAELMYTLEPILPRECNPTSIDIGMHVREVLGFPGMRQAAG
jgi:hypothetical protein